MQKHKND